MNLFGDFLSVSADSQINAGEDVLFVDEEALKTDPDAPVSYTHLDVYKRQVWSTGKNSFIKSPLSLKIQPTCCF